MQNPSTSAHPDLADSQGLHHPIHSVRTHDPTSITSPLPVSTAPDPQTTTSQSRDHAPISLH